MTTPLALLIPERFRAIHRQHVERFAAAGQEIARKMGDRDVAVVGLRKTGEEFPADASISKLEVGGERILTVARESGAHEVWRVRCGVAPGASRLRASLTHGRNRGVSR
jgi:hypothetical protein